MRRKYLWVAVGFLMALSLVIAACGPAKEAQAPATKPTPAPAPTGPTGTMRVAITDFGVESFDPNNTVATWGGAMYDPVINWNDKGNNVGAAAESWTISADGRTWTFKVRKGVKWHNGDPLTSADFVFSINRFKSDNTTNPWAPRVRLNFESNSAPDELTYVHTTKTPELTLVASFAALPILPSKYIQEIGMDAFNKNPIGTGPWKVVKFTSETSIEFEANRGHWDGSPYFEKVIQLQVPEEATRVGMLKRGEVDLIFVSTDRTVELRDEGFRLQKVGLPTVGNISFSGTWMTKGPTSDIRVRKAMSYAINRQELSDTFYRGLAKPGSRWFMSDVTWGWDPSWKPEPYDFNLAKKLLDEAGYPQKFSTPTIKLFTTAPNADLMQILQGYWKKAGVDVAIEIVESRKFFDLMFVRATDPSQPIVGAIWPWVSPNTFQNVYHSSNMFTSKGVHTTANDPAMDTLYDAVLKETNPETQKRLWTEFTQKGYEMYINVGLVELPTNWVVSKNLGEFSKKAHLDIQYSLSGIKHP